MGGSDDGGPQGIPERRDTLTAMALALVHGWSDPASRVATRLHGAGPGSAHDVGVAWARALLRIEPFGMPGQTVAPWSELGRARRRCRLWVGHCPHPLTGMGLEWGCCCCGALLDPPPAGQACRVCNLAAAIDRGPS